MAAFPWGSAFIAPFLLYETHTLFPLYRLFALSPYRFLAFLKE